MLTTPQKAIEEINQRDVSVDIFSKAEEINIDAVTANMEGIMLTMKGELHRRKGYGSNFKRILHELPDDETIRTVMEDVYNDLEALEPNILIDRENTRIIIKNREKAVFVIMPFIYIKYGTLGKFTRKFSQ